MQITDTAQRTVVKELSVIPARRLGEVQNYLEEEKFRERLASIARYYGNLIGVKYGESFVVKETMRVDDVATLPVRSF